ncbi:AraC family transcriptional regulator [Streptomyces albidoflavus]
MTAGQQIHAWRPPVPGVAEVFHAHFTEHAYPMHVHDVWTLLLVDDGAVRYDLDRHPHGTPADTVTLLPPHVPHNGSPATAHGFRKRVLYLDLTQLGPELVGPAVDRPELADARLRQGLTLDEAAALLHAHPAHLVRAFSGAFGIAPHQYLTTLRVGRARRLLLDGLPPGEVATAAGFYDQSHLNRHFRKVVGTTPGRYARTGAPGR